MKETHDPTDLFIEAQTRQRRATPNFDRNLVLPLNISRILLQDPKLIGFIAARHKVVSKFLGGKRVLEVGCQEGFGTLFVSPYVSEITSIDFFPPFIDGFKNHTLPHLRNCSLLQHDILSGPLHPHFEGAFALDVLEHIDPLLEDLFWRNCADSLMSDGIFIIGMPSIESQVYASEASRNGHVNCKTGEALRSDALRYFKNVLMLSMNDEVLHTGFFPMSHYLFAVCCNKRASNREPPW